MKVAHLQAQIKNSSYSFHTMHMTFDVPLLTTWPKPRNPLQSCTFRVSILVLIAAWRDHVDLLDVVLQVAKKICGNDVHGLL